MPPPPHHQGQIFGGNFLLSFFSYLSHKQFCAGYNLNTVLV
jgi:hypothetical protein